MKRRKRGNGRERERRMGRRRETEREGAKWHERYTRGYEINLKPILEVRRE